MSVDTDVVKHRTQVNSVVQLDPNEHDDFGGCLVVVTEVRDWGVQGYVQIPNSGLAFYRAKWGAFALIGTAMWAAE